MNENENPYFDYTACPVEVLEEKAQAAASQAARLLSVQVWDFASDFAQAQASTG